MERAANSPLKIAVIGAGISGLSAGWLLGQRHQVTLYEQAARLGGHSNTVDVRLGGADVPVDTGFIVYNEQAYPNLSAMFRHLGVATKPTDMTFSVSLEGGRLEYAGGNLAGLFAQPSNLARPRYWAMLSDIVRFYRNAPAIVERAGDAMTLGALLDAGKFGQAFRHDHLLPMAGAIWSVPPATMLEYPAASFVRFFENHGLLNLTNRPLWRTVAGGSRQYVARLMEQFTGDVRTAAQAVEVRRSGDRVSVKAEGCEPAYFDHVVIATHADQALAMLADADDRENRLLGAFRYTRNRAWLHSDQALMPRRVRAWASWNYLTRSASEAGESSLCVTYWMNRLQALGTQEPVFVTLNPVQEPAPSLIHHVETYDHPVFDAGALRSQRSVWSLQGLRRTWFCGAYFGSGFHEDGLQAGLAVAEQLGGCMRPWRVENESGRICTAPVAAKLQPMEVVA